MTDIDDRAVAFARAGRDRRTAGLSAQVLDRWFAGDGDEFCPIREIRETCIFSVHSIVKDPPFSKLDLVSCRNLLIYFEPVLQDHVLRMFHYALNPNGLLFLGPSEGVSRQAKLFASLDKKHHLFQRRDVHATFQGVPFFAPWPVKLHVAGAPLPPAKIRSSESAPGAGKIFSRLPGRRQGEQHPAFLGRRSGPLPRAVAGCGKPQSHQQFTESAPWCELRSRRR